ncbi:hypothetical protein KGQ71_01485 [Patescibacteria group bacterium]|nr:hypothetical protein [Patescibacteria group bacterium]
MAPRPQDIGQMLDIVGTHPTGECDGDRINTRRVAQVLCQSWGYWQTAQLNFRRMEQRLLTTETADRPPAMERLAALRDQIAGSPKSIRWQVRAVLGQGLRWYSEVEDTDVF